MSEAADHEDRTEQPSEKRLREARERGDVPRSRELANVAVLGVAVIALKATAGHLGGASRDWMQGALRFDRTLLDSPDALPAHAASLFYGLVIPMLPLILAALAACAIAPMAMGGVRFASKMGQLAGNHFITLTSGLENLATLGKSVLWKGALPIRFEEV